MPRVEPSAPMTLDHQPGRYRYLVIGILLLAAVWRAWIATSIPCISRDSVMFCWYARDLGAQGWEYLRQPATAQHPLFPVTVLAAQRVARLFGAPDTPMTWQASGQVVSCLAGMALVVLAGAITLRLVRRLNLPIDARLTGCCGMLLAALLPLNVWHSAEVMSDQLHAALYLLGVFALLKLDNWKATLLCGLAAGLAFLTRPEGLVVMLAGIITAASDRGSAWKVRFGRSVVLVSVFLIFAGPYWLTTGTLSSKKNPLNWLRSSDVAIRMTPATDDDRVAHGFSRGEHESRHSPCAPPSNTFGYRSPLLARLQLLDLSWYAIVPWALWMVLRAGRVVIPLLALFPVFNLRKRWFSPPLIGLTACMVGHFILTMLLLYKYHYLAKRHMLVIIMLLIPFAAMLLCRLLELTRQRRGGVVPALIFGICLLPLAVYALRQPNHADKFLVEAAQELVNRDPEISQKVIMGGSSIRRIVFYANARWKYWYEAPDDYEGLQRQIITARPDYFIIETGPGFERRGNQNVVEQLGDDVQLAATLKSSATTLIPEGGELHTFLFDWDITSKPVGH
ncbi:MAG: hypothetical protein ABIG44_13515 [Planctomycetota bacterium]